MKTKKEIKTFLISIKKDVYNKGMNITVQNRIDIKRNIDNFIKEL